VETQSLASLADLLHGLEYLAVVRRRTSPTVEPRKTFEPERADLVDVRNKIEVLARDDGVALKVDVGRGLAALEFELEVLGLSMTGSVFGIPTTVVTPPAAAARVADSPVFLYSRPGSRLWMWQSTIPEPARSLGVEDAISLRKTVASADGDDSSVLDGDARVGRPARRRDDGTVTHDEIHGHCRGVAEDRAYSFPNGSSFAAPTTPSSDAEPV